MGFKENLQNQRDNFIKVFEDTLSLCKKSYQKEIDYSILNTQFYDKDFYKKLKLVIDEDFTYNIDITNHRTFEGAILLKEQYNKVAVLNFASATNPGGGVLRGSSAQEECLCRASTLYPVLNTKENLKRYYHLNRKEGTPLHDDALLYSKDIVVFKSDDKEYKILPKSYKIDVITCAAPNLRETPRNAFNEEVSSEPVTVSDEELFNLHYKRAKAIVMTAYANKVDALVLGAFGCGAFKNNPKVVAKTYHKLLVEEKYAMLFKKVEFAIYCNSYEDQNFKAFKEEFKSN